MNEATAQSVPLEIERAEELARQRRYRPLGAHMHPERVLAWAEEIRRLREGLQRHGRHIPECSSWKGLTDWPPERGPCDCGLAVLVADWQSR